MAEETEQELLLVDAELHQVEDQISSLLELQRSLLDKREELQAILQTYREDQFEETTSFNVGLSRKTEEDWAGIFSWDERAADLRKNFFGISSYRTNQREIINAVMSGKDVVVIMAAGGGKSLCYQLPALLRPGVALVVSPLVSLIEDQVMGLMALDIPARNLTSSTSKEEEKAIYAAVEKNEGDLRILYVTPEKIAKSKRFMSKLEKCNHAGRLSLMAIDEAHCCSQWGHDFRPDYKSLGMLKTQFPKVPMIALTATATQRVQTDLREMLHLTFCERFVSSINRPNLFYEIRNKQANAMGAIDDIADFIKSGYKKKESGIVYCFSRRECEQVAEELRKRSVSAAHYHAYMEADEKSRVHTRWNANKIQVIVGTVAFGMGINKPDVRFVIHHSLSKSLETYYQESGRAGRDGLPAHCVLYFRPTDLSRQSSMVFAENAGLPNLYAIARFCQSRKACRRVAFFRHFGEKEQDCSGMCDNCAYAKDVVDQDVTAHARSLMLHLKDLSSGEQKVTVLQLLDSWRARSRQSGPDSALIKDLAKEDVERVIIQLLLDGLLKEEFQHTAYATNAYIALSANSRSFTEGRSGKRVLLEVVKGDKAKVKQPGARNVEDSSMLSGMGQMLDSLRLQIATSRGSNVPHSVLSSQHISALCARRPQSLDQVEDIVGKRKAELYGQPILEAIADYTKQNPKETSEHTGSSVNQKGRRSDSIPSSVTTSRTPNPALKSTNGKVSTGKPRKEDKLKPTTPKDQDTVTKDCINLDTDSEKESEGPSKAGGANGTAGKRTESHPYLEDSDDEFVLVKRQVKRNKS